jgi:GR25 family glycosyltransferase involved in LPS biosynthesis
MKIQYYLIHGIDRERKPFMESQFRSYGIPAEDVKWITWPNKQDTLPEGICTNFSLPKGMVACTYKHYLILKDICENKHPLAVIMEDNIEFKGNVSEAISRYLKDLPENWDCLFDSDFYGLKFIEGPVDGKSVYKKSNNITEQCGGSSKGAHFLLVNLEAAQKLYSGFLPFHDCSDHWYNHIFRLQNMNVFWAEPSNVHKINRPSTWKEDPLTQSKKIRYLRFRI